MSKDIKPGDLVEMWLHKDMLVNKLAIILTDGYLVLDCVSNSYDNGHVFSARNLRCFELRKIGTASPLMKAILAGVYDL